MVQVISLDTKELTPQKAKNIKVDSNIDFLELLMKDIEDTKIDTKDKNSKIDTVLVKNAENDNMKESLEDEKTILNLDEKIDLEDIESNKDIKFLMQSDVKFKDEIVKEVKNIIQSKIKQQNILLSKNDIKEFKKIDNIKDLLKFADKKGLNIKNIKFEIPKEIRNNKLFKNFIDKTDNRKHINTKNILEKKQTIQITTNNSQTKSTNKLQIITNNSQKAINTEPTNISLENVLNKKEIKTNQKDKNSKKIDNIVAKDKSVNSTKISKNIDNIFQNKITQPQTEKKDIHINQTKTPKLQKEINLSDLISNNTDITKKEVKKKAKISQNNINLNQTPINEIKAKSIQAKQTIESFKNNLDEAIKNYKPPISKVDIELNPKNLGKVEVSIIQRGNNIQVHMNTDQSNVALFQTHQAEFRQALANIGFSNIDMSFNSNQDKERKQNQAKKTYKDNESEEIGDIEIKADYKYA